MPHTPDTDDTGLTAAERLCGFVERIEALEEDRAQVADDIRAVKAKAKAAGFDLKALREVLRQRRMSREDREQWEALVDTYKSALGMLADTPLGEAAITRTRGRAKTAQAAQAANPAHH